MPAMRQELCLACQSCDMGSKLDAILVGVVLPGDTYHTGDVVEDV